MALVLVGITQGASQAMIGSIWPEYFGTRHLGSIRAVAVAAMVFSTAIGPGLTRLLIDQGIGFETQCLWMGGYVAVVSLIFVGVSRNAHFELLSLPNCWFIHRDYNSIGEGIQFLMDEQVTTIFVFSDFQDTINREYVDTLRARAKEDKYRITLHVLEEVRDKNGEPSLQMLAKESRGLYAVGELLKRARR